MSSYLFINISVVLLPLLFSFEKRIRFYRRSPSVAASVLIVGMVYIVWDSIATARGDWNFNSDHVMDFRLLGLPLEEILFFITVPYACIFIYEVLRSYFNDRIFRVPAWFRYSIPVPFIIIALGTPNQPYTHTVSLFTAAFFILSSWLYPSLTQSKLFWVFIMISFVPFFLVNYLLTSIPIVTYGEDAFSGIRITTIPLEDFFYSFSMLAFYLLVYKLVLNRWQPNLQ
jgi:lycopene cyclase domain-containing protein